MVSIIISIISLAISVYTLWKIHLSPFKLLITFGNPNLRTYKITPKTSGGKGTWYIPSVDIPFSFTNSGAKPGRVINIRIVLTPINNKSQKVKKYKEILEARWCVNYTDYNSKSSERFAWLSDSMENEWYPFYVLHDKPIVKHIIFESGRWDKFIQRDLKVKLQFKSDESSKWIVLKTYEFRMGKFEISELKNGSSFVLQNKKISSESYDDRIALEDSQE